MILAFPQACATLCAQKFVSALASLTERMLLEFDECITIDEVQETSKSLGGNTCHMPLAAKRQEGVCPPESQMLQGLVQPLA